VVPASEELHPCIKGLKKIDFKLNRIYDFKALHKHCCLQIMGVSVKHSRLGTLWITEPPATNSAEWQPLPSANCGQVAKLEDFDISTGLIP
jgi:hypothetical protein